MEALLRSFGNGIMGVVGGEQKIAMHISGLIQAFLQVDCATYAMEQQREHLPPKARLALQKSVKEGKIGWSRPPSMQSAYEELKSLRDGLMAFVRKFNVLAARYEDAAKEAQLPQDVLDSYVILSNLTDMGAQIVQKVETAGGNIKEYDLAMQAWQGSLFGWKSRIEERLKKFKADFKHKMTTQASLKADMISLLGQQITGLTGYLNGHALVEAKKNSKYGSYALTLLRNLMSPLHVEEEYDPDLDARCGAANLCFKVLRNGVETRLCTETFS